MERIPHDEFGPEYIVEVYDPVLGMRGFLVVDNTALGPGKGGIRMTPDVTLGEIYRLAHTMTWKNALAGIPFGGAKAGIVWNGGPAALKKKFVQSFAKALAPLMPAQYIAGPDVNSGEPEMQWFAEATGKWETATGKPGAYCVQGSNGKKKCGIPHEFGSTGYGVVHATRAAAEIIGFPIKNATVAIHGFGNVGTFAYKHLTEMGARVVALADKGGAVYARDGFDPKKIDAVVRSRGSLTEAFKKNVISEKSFWAVPVDILIPASVTDVINESNKRAIRAKMIVEAGNIPMQEKIERELWKRGIVIVPDFVANAGGVISSYAEYRGYSPKAMFGLVKRKVVHATRAVMQQSILKKKFPRDVALRLARSLVKATMQKRKKN